MKDRKYIPGYGDYTVDQSMDHNERSDFEDRRFLNEEMRITRARMEEYQPEDETVRPAKRENVHDDAM